MPAISKASTRSRSTVRRVGPNTSSKSMSGTKLISSTDIKGNTKNTFFTFKNHWIYVKVLLACVTLASTAALVFAAHAVVDAESQFHDLELSYLDIGQKMTKNNTTTMSSTPTTIALTKSVNNMTFTSRLDNTKLDTAELRTQMNELQFDIATLKTQIFDPLFRALKSGRKLGSKIETFLVSAYNDTHMNLDQDSRGKYFRLRKALRQSIEGAISLDVKEASDANLRISFPEKLETEVLRKECKNQNSSKFPLSLDMSTVTDEFTVHFEEVDLCAPSVTRVSVAFAPLGQGTKKVRVVVGEL